MKVGTDAVLLGAWTNVKKAKHILDIGTGSGVIAIMMAQRTGGEADIDAVEMLAQDAAQAKENAERSLWKNNVKIYCTPVQKFFPEIRYDLIISNPPFFVNSLAPPDLKRYQARHSVTLSFDELLDAVTRLLHPSGTFNTILPYSEGLKFIELATTRGMHCRRQCGFKSKKNKPVERLLLEFALEPKETETGEIILYDESHQWSEEYRTLTREFYLKA